MKNRRPQIATIEGEAQEKSLPDFQRLRRLRKTAALRGLVEETTLSAAHLIAPLFVYDGATPRSPIQAMPGIFRLNLSALLQTATHLAQQGIGALALFPAIDPALRTFDGKEALSHETLLCRALSLLKQEIPELCLIADVALDPYTTHGHDCLMNPEGEVENDATVERLAQMALLFAQAGADLIAPSDMMDGRVCAIREALDKRGFAETGILAYSAKFASHLYAPFRDALSTRLAFGDKKSYQLNPANRREAILEALADEEEGADILMVKPALYYLDVISELRRSTHRPIAAYQVSGEYSMVMAAAAAGYLSPDPVFWEGAIAIRRAGADMLFTYAYESLLNQLRLRR